MLLILSSLLTFLHRLEDVPGLCPATQLVKPQSREPRFLSPSRKRVDHCPISISPPRRPVLLQPRARRPEEAGRPEATLQPAAPSELRGRAEAGGRRHHRARSGRRGLRPRGLRRLRGPRSPGLRVLAVARRACRPPGRSRPSAQAFAASVPWSPYPSDGAV